MMKSTIYNTFLLLSAVLLAACSADTGTSTPAVEEIPLKFTASVRTSAADTRAYHADTYNSALPADTRIDVFIYDSNGRDVSEAQNLGLTAQTWVFRTSGEVDEESGRSVLVQESPSWIPKFPGDIGTDGYVDVLGVFFPPGSSVSPEQSNITPLAESFTFTVASDQTKAENIVACDLLANDVTSTFEENAAAINLEMKHRMAKVLVRLNPTEDLTETNMPTTFNASIQPSVKVTLKPSESQAVGEFTTMGATSVTANVGEPFFMPPQTITKGTEFLSFDLRNVDGSGTGIKHVSFSPSSDMEFRDGVFYELTLNVGIRYINLTCTIKDWVGETILFDKVIL